MALSLQRYLDPWPDSRLTRLLRARNEEEQEISTVVTLKVKDFLPTDVIIEILSWLPVKDLLRFKSVSKSWHAIISSALFISKHLKNNYRINESGCLLLNFFVSHFELQLFALLVDDDTPRVLAHEVLYDMPMYGALVYGPCDGVYYVFDYGRLERALWNPAIDDEPKILPPIISKPNLPPNLKHTSNEVYGFGFDPASQDYKVVVIRGLKDDQENIDGYPLSVFVYSLKTDSWRYLGDLSQYYALKQNTCYVVVDGCFYWLGSCELYQTPEVMISFDMGTDTIQEISVPFINDKPSTHACLAIYNGSLNFLAIDNGDGRLDVWTWSDGLWTEKFTMDLDSDITCPIGHWKNKFVLQCYGGLVLCDPETQELDDLEFRRGVGFCQGLYAYQESLVSMKDRKQVAEALT